MVTGEQRWTLREKVWSCVLFCSRFVSVVNFDSVPRVLKLIRFIVMFWSLIKNQFFISTVALSIPDISPFEYKSFHLQALWKILTKLYKPRASAAVYVINRLSNSMLEHELRWLTSSDMCENLEIWSSVASVTLLHIHPSRNASGREGTESVVSTIPTLYLLHHI